MNYNYNNNCNKKFRFEISLNNNVIVKFKKFVLKFCLKGEKFNIRRL